MGRMVSYGHSWIDGDGASSPSKTIAALAASQLGLKLDNRGVGGSSSTGTAALVATNPPPRAVVYLLMTGLNDLRLGGEAPSYLQAYRASLTATLGAFRAAAPEAVVVVVEQPHLVDFSQHAPHNLGSNDLVDVYNAELRRAAAAASALVAVAEDWDAGSMLDPDTVHANDAGHACLAGAVVAAVTAAWR